MMDNITLGRYYPGDSPLHRMDPRLKILVAILTMTAVFLIRKPVAIAVLTASLYGVMTEIYQMFTPDRSAEVLDALMNVAGGLLGASSFVAVRIYNDMMMRQGA